MNGNSFEQGEQPTSRFKEFEADIIRYKHNDITYRTRQTLWTYGSYNGMPVCWKNKQDINSSEYIYYHDYPITCTLKRCERCDSSVSNRVYANGMKYYICPKHLGDDDFKGKGLCYLNK
jgi:hypothetical protein